MNGEVRRRKRHTDQDKMDMKQRDGGGQKKNEKGERVVCVCVRVCANGSVLLRRGGQLWHRKTMEGEGESSRTPQKQGRRRSGAALHARLLLLTAHQESRMNEPLTTHTYTHPHTHSLTHY